MTPIRTISAAATALGIAVALTGCALLPWAAQPETVTPAAQTATDTPATAGTTATKPRTTTPTVAPTITTPAGAPLSLTGLDGSTLTTTMGEGFYFEPGISAVRGEAEDTTVLTFEPADETNPARLIPQGTGTTMVKLLVEADGSVLVFTVTVN